MFFRGFNLAAALSATCMADEIELINSNVIFKKKTDKETKKQVRATCHLALPCAKKMCPWTPTGEMCKVLTVTFFDWSIH